MARYDDERLESFFARYGEALTTGDLPAIAGCYAVPALVLSHTGSVPIATREQIEAAFRGAAESYEAQSLVATRPTLVRSEVIAEWLVCADVHWEYLDERGHSVHRDDYHYDYRYVLRVDDEAGLQIQVVIEMPAGVRQHRSMALPSLVRYDDRYEERSPKHESFACTSHPRE